MLQFHNIGRYVDIRLFLSLFRSSAEYQGDILSTRFYFCIETDH